jgi:hypothetical protein
MSLEFLMDQSSQETQPMLLRMLKATEKMTETINQLRIEEQRSRISNSPIKPDM